MKEFSCQGHGLPMPKIVYAYGYNVDEINTPVHLIGRLMLIHARMQPISDDVKRRHRALGFNITNTTNNFTKPVSLYLH